MVAFSIIVYTDVYLDLQPCIYELGFAVRLVPYDYDRWDGLHSKGLLSTDDER